jgi:hypothetical protein
MEKAYNKEDFIILPISNHSAKPVPHIKGGVSRLPKYTIYLYNISKIFIQKEINQNQHDYSITIEGTMAINSRYVIYHAFYLSELSTILDKHSNPL